MYIDLKLPRLKGRKEIEQLILIRDSDVTSVRAIRPYFYVIYKNKKILKEIEKFSGVVEVEEVDMKPIIKVHGSRYEVKSDYGVAKVKCQLPTQVPDVARDVLALQRAGVDVRASMFNVRYLARCSWDLGLQFFDTKPLYYVLDVSTIQNLRKLKVLILDVEAREEKPILASTYVWTPFEEIRPDDVQCYELPKQFDELEKEINRYRLLAGHNIVGFDIPILRRSGVVIPVEQIAIFDTSQTLATWGQSLAIGSARALHDVAEVLKDKVGITDEELKIKKEGKKRLNSMNLDELAKYNINDVVITAKIMIVPFSLIAVLSALTQIPMSILQNLPAGMVAEYFFTHECEVRGFVPEYRAVKWRASASRVWLEREKVLYTNVAQFDIKMMYPSFVLANFVDPTLLVKEPEATMQDIGSVVEDMVERIEFDRRSGLGILYATVLKLKKIRELTKKLKKKSPMYEPVDHSIKAVLNALAYGVQGKQASPAPLGNLACPTKIFYGTYKIQMGWIQYLRSRGWKVIYSDTDSIFVVVNSGEDIQKLAKDIADYLSRFGLEADLEDVWNVMYIYSRKSYILQGKKVVLKGSPIKSLLRFRLPKVITDNFVKIVSSSYEERIKLIRELIDSADIEDLFTYPANQLYRLIGKDLQSVKREIKVRGKYYLRVFTPWEEPRSIYLKKANVHQFATPQHAPLIELLRKAPKVPRINLADYEGYVVLEARCLPCKRARPLNKLTRADMLMYGDDGNIYAITLEDILYYLSTREGRVLKVRPSETGRIYGESLVVFAVESKMKVDKLRIDEDILRNCVHEYTKIKLREIGIL
ncbi:MAG: hypothetical protein DRJ40_08250 [Thermoprotei archaeon]|nr:MAG: hypothetical protein DRJ40_08250 [Thermoprotei archaeon]